MLAAWTDLTATLQPSPMSADKISGLVSLTVTNTSATPGREVVQIYISDPESSHRRPIKELKGFAKTPMLQPGESATVSVKLDKISLSFWDDLESTWVAQKGAFEISAAKSARAEDKVLGATVTLDTTLTWLGV